MVAGQFPGPRMSPYPRAVDHYLAAYLKKKPLNEVVGVIAKSFIGTDYAANTIDAPGKEQLIVNLQTLDCVTFYENSLVLARCIKKNSMNFEDFKKELQFVRYRGGVIDGYASRLHYTSDYFFDNENKSILKDMTKELGGVPFKKKIDFMSTHTNLYLQLNKNQLYPHYLFQKGRQHNYCQCLYFPLSNIREYHHCSLQLIHPNTFF